MEAFTRKCEGQLIWTEGERIAGSLLDLALCNRTVHWKREDVVSERNRDILFFEFGMKCIGGR